jgi:hypothetical protein
MVNYGDLQFSERIMVARRSEMSAEWKVGFAICIASVAIQASGIDRKDLIQYKEKNANNRVPFVITYHPALSNLRPYHRMESMAS